MAKVTSRKETGRLVIDFTHKGVRCREQTALADTPANRKRAEATVKRLKSALSDGSFNYAPGGHPNFPTYGHPNCSTWVR